MGIDWRASERLGAMSFVELSLDATEEAIDWIRSLLATVDYSGELQVDEAAEPWAFHVRFYLSDRTKVNQIENALSSLHRTGMTTELETAIVEHKTESTTVNHRIGNRFVIGSATAPDDIELNIQASLAFGSGFHPATILSLQLIERHVTSDLQVLDLGCGSGILSVAMAKLGANVLAIDNDAIAVKATQEALTNNNVQELVTTQVASLGKGSDLGHWMGGETGEVLSIEPNGSFDLIVANVFARIIIRLSEDLRKALRPNGKLILAGFTIEYEEELNEALGALGFEVIDRLQTGDWISLVYQPLV